MRRGIVMSIHNKHAVVLTQDGQFIRAPLSGNPQIGEEIEFEEAADKRALLNRLNQRFVYMGAAAAMLLLFAVVLLYAHYSANQVVAYLTVDVNPSIEMGVNERGQVRELRALNDAGTNIIQDMAYKGHSVEEVATNIFERVRSSHYLDAAHKDIIITSAMLSGKSALDNNFGTMLADKIDGQLQAMLKAYLSESYNVNVMTLSVSVELRNAADANGVSMGKMAVYLMAKNEGYELELNQFKETSIDKITEPIGGVKKIVEDAGDTSKDKLQELLDLEKQELAAAKEAAAKEAAAKEEAAKEAAAKEAAAKEAAAKEAAEKEEAAKDAAAKETSAKKSSGSTSGNVVKPNATIQPKHGTGYEQKGGQNWFEWDKDGRYSERFVQWQVEQQKKNEQKRAERQKKNEQKKDEQQKKNEQRKGEQQKKNEQKRSEQQKKNEQKRSEQQKKNEKKRSEQ